MQNKTRKYILNIIKIIFLIEAIFMIFFIVRLFLPKKTVFVTDTSSMEKVYELPYGRYMFQAVYNCPADYTGDRIQCWLSGENVKQEISYMYPDSDEHTVEVWLMNRVNHIGFITIVPDNIELVSLKLTETNYSNYQALLLLLSILIITVLLHKLLSGKIHISLKTWGTVSALAVILLMAVIPLFNDYIILGYDTTFHFSRIEGIKAGILSGQLPVRIDPIQNAGYGYATPMFYGDALMYIPAILRIMGFTLEASYKFYIFFLKLITLASIYYCLNTICNKRSSVLAGTALFTLSVYQFTAFYSRSALGGRLQHGHFFL